jgi:hypothetical protein
MNFSTLSAFIGMESTSDSRPPVSDSILIMTVTHDEPADGSYQQVWFISTKISSLFFIPVRIVLFEELEL